MNVLLLNILVNIEAEELNSPPLGLAYIATMIEYSGHTVRVFNLTPEEIQNGRWKADFKDFSPKVVGATLITPLYQHIVKFFEIVKSISPSVHIIVGGPHAAALPDDTIKEPSISSVVRGEGEYIIQDLLYAIENHQDFSKIKGLSYKRGSSVFHNQDIHLIGNLDALPFPAWHLFDMKKFKNLAGERRIMGLMGSRGCPFHCVFCYRGPSSSEKVRFRSLGSIFEEIRFLRENYEFDGINFWDDVFTLDRERTKDFCIEFRKNFSDLIWYCQTRIDCLEEELLELIEASGCRLIRLGVESGDDRTLELLNKKITVSMIREKFRLIKQRAKLRTKAYFILGFPWDTYDTVQNTIHFAKELGADETMFLIATPYPGTRLYELTKKQLIYPQRDWSQYNHFCNRKEIIPFYHIPGINKYRFLELVREVNYELNAESCLTK